MEQQGPVLDLEILHIVWKGMMTLNYCSKGQIVLMHPSQLQLVPKPSDNKLICLLDQPLSPITSACAGEAPRMSAQTWPSCWAESGVDDKDSQWSWRKDDLGVPFWAFAEGPVTIISIQVSKTKWSHLPCSDESCTLRCGRGDANGVDEQQSSGWPSESLSNIFCRSSEKFSSLDW